MQRELLKQVYSTYVPTWAPQQINIKDGVRIQVVKAYDTEDWPAMVEAMKDAQREIVGLMGRDSFKRFQQSDLWGQMNQAIQHRIEHARLVPEIDDALATRHHTRMAWLYRTLACRGEQQTYSKAARQWLVGALVNADLTKRRDTVRPAAWWENDTVEVPHGWGDSEGGSESSSEDLPEFDEPPKAAPMSVVIPETSISPKKGHHRRVSSVLPPPADEDWAAALSEEPRGRASSIMPPPEMDAEDEEDDTDDELTEKELAELLDQARLQEAKVEEEAAYFAKLEAAEQICLSAKVKPELVKALGFEMEQERNPHQGDIVVQDFTLAECVTRPRETLWSFGECIEQHRPQDILFFNF